MKSLNDLLYPVVAMCAGTAFTGQLIRLRGSYRDPGVVALCVSFGFFAAVFTVSTPRVWISVDQFFGIPEVAGLLAQSLVILFAASQQSMLLLWSYPLAQAKSEIHLRLAWVAIVCVAMATLFAVTPRGGGHSRDFAVHYAGVPTYSIYLLFYLTAFSVTKIDVIRISLQYAPLSGEVWLRRGLRFMATGSALGLVYAAVRVSDIIGALVGADPRHWEFVAQISVGVGAIIEIFGLAVMPRWGRHLSAAYDWLQQGRHYRKLRPLWFALYQAVPDIALEVPRPAWMEWFPMCDARFLLTRRVIEIRDASLALCRYRSSQVEATARALVGERGIEGEECAAVVEAAMLATALRARAVDANFTVPEWGASSKTGETDMSQEVVWLLRVTRAFAGSPIVAAVLAGDRTQGTVEAEATEESR